MNVQQPPIGGEEPGFQNDEMGDEMPMNNMETPVDNNEQPQNGESEFDTNFDAGVEADEDTDPEKYIQQLTGKLSTTLNSFNSENGDNSGLNKYVAKMIVKAATKNMDDTEKKDIIKAINTSQNPEPEDEDNVGGEAPDDNQEIVEPQVQNDEEGLQESVRTKKELVNLIHRRKK